MPTTAAFQYSLLTNPTKLRHQYYWLLSLIGLTLAMIILGGLTRLTNSGLSMVAWRLFMGIIPPLNATAWEDTFRAYQQYPEYQLLRPQMTLIEFKQIFIFEYAHRMLGRLIGLSTIIPLGWWWIRGALTRRESIYFSLLASLVMLQGAAGWFMVKSGLVNIPQVSHFRLTLHLVLAVIFMGLALFLFLPHRLAHLARSASASSPQPNRQAYLTQAYHWILLPSLSLASIVLAVQFCYGAFMAGLSAGYVSSSYPAMFGKLIPWSNLAPAYAEKGIASLMTNAVWIHFIHRHLGLLASGLLCWFGFRSLSRYYKHKQPVHTRDTLPLKALSALLVLSFIQPLLGILTVFWHVPLSLAILHQFLAMLLVAALVILWFYRFYSPLQKRLP